MVPLIGMSQSHKGHDVYEILQAPALARTLSTFDSFIHKCMQKKRTLNITQGTSTVLIQQILKWPWVQIAVLNSWAIETQQPTFLKQKLLQYPIC